MTRKRKIAILKSIGFDIESHYAVGENYKRLVIDKIGKVYYTNTSKDQVLAGLEIDDLFTEVIEND